MKLLSDKVAIVLDKPVTETKSGLYLGKEEQPTTGVVKFVGPGKFDRPVDTYNSNGGMGGLKDMKPYREPMLVKVDDRVVVPTYGIDIEVEGIKYRILHESEIVAILD